MELISVIVPVYHAERYLEKCIKSIVMQTWENLELILVDDGSADHSFEICLKYAQKDDRIRLIRQEHCGVTEARKAGILAALGTVIAFADSDDWMEPEAIARMYEEMEKHHADIVAAGYIETYGHWEQVIKNRLKEGVYSKERLNTEVYPKMLCHAEFFELGMTPYLWNKLYRREIIEPYIMSLDKKLTIGEDVLCVFPALLQSDVVSILPDAYYHYCIHEASAMRSFRSEKEEVQNIRTQYRAWNRILLTGGQRNVLLPQVNRYLLHHLIVRVPGYLERYMHTYGLSFLEPIETGSQIVLYGAGAFGIALYDWWKQIKQVSVVGWCDRNYRNLQKTGYPVMSPEAAIGADFDYIVIAVLNQGVKEQIQSGLISEGIQREWIRWLNVKSLQEINLPELMEQKWENGTWKRADNLYIHQKN